MMRHHPINVKHCSVGVWLCASYIIRGGVAGVASKPIPDECGESEGRRVSGLEATTS